MKSQIKMISRLKGLNIIVIIIALIICISSIAVSAAPDPQKIKNIAPTIDLNVTPAKKPVDIVIMTDYTGTKLAALNTQINALKAQFTAVNVEPAFHIVSDVKTVGTQNDELYEFARYGHFYYKVSGYRRYKNYGVEESYTNYTLDRAIEWERMQGLKSQFLSMPAKNPMNVKFTKGPEMKTDTTSTFRLYHNITISCTNDVKTSGMVEEEKYYKSTSSGTIRKYNSSGDYNDRSFTILSEWAEIDAKWTMEDKVSDVSYPIYSFNFDKLSTVPLRAGSDRHLIFLSDGVNKDYSQATGNYFSFGDMTDTLKSYINTNKFVLYGVVPEDARNRSLNADKVSKIVPIEGTTLYYMEDGTVQKVGDANMKELWADKMYPQETADIGVINETVEGYYGSVYLMADGTIKYCDGPEFVTLAGLTNITKLYYFSDYYVINSSGQVFRIDDRDYRITPFNNSVAISSIIHLQSELIFLTSAGIPYVTSFRYDKSLRTYTYDLLTQLQIATTDADGDITALTNMPAIKDADWYTASAPIYSIKPMIFLYPSGQIRQFIKFTDNTVYSGANNRYETNYTCLVDETNSILETGVSSIDSCGVGMFIFKTNGTVKLSNCSWVQEDGRIRDEDDDWVNITYMRPYLKNTTEMTTLTNIVETQLSEYGYYFMTDSGDNTYMLKCTTYCPVPVSGSDLTNLGKVKKIVEEEYNKNKYIEILFENGTVRELTFGYSGALLSNVMLPYTEVKNVYVCPLRVFLLMYDGSVLAKGGVMMGN